MMTIKFTTDNSAFRNVFTGEPDESVEAKECIRVLDAIETHLRHGYRSGSCIDYNGNKVGEWSLE